jgi:ABC-type Fe3+ transport system substrate-binding protein
MKCNARLRATCAGGFAAVGILLSIAAPAPAAQFNDALKALIKQADSEGALSLTWGGTTLGGVQGAERAQAEMNKMFGTKIRIDFVPGPDMARVANQLTTEYTAKQKAHVDIMLGAAAQIAPMVRADELRSIDWRALMPDRIAPEMIEMDGRMIRIVTGLSGATYNSGLAPMKPTTLQDFLRPEWKGRIASTPYAAGFDVLVADDVWGEAKTFDYVRKLSKQVAGLIRCGDTERIAMGEYLAIVMDCTGQDALVWQEKGAPIDQMMPLDAAEERYYYVTIPKHAVHPAAATLYSLYLMTPEGQKFAYDSWKTDLHLFAGSKMSAIIADYRKRNVPFKEVTVAWWLQHPEIDRKRSDLIKIITTKQ